MVWSLLCLKSDITCRSIGCAKFLSMGLYQIGMARYNMMYDTINSIIAADPNADLSELFISQSTGVDILQTRNRAYLLAHLTGWVPHTC